jgi:integrating conjugative element relaxase (TIGR03760 family)
VFKRKEKKDSIKSVKAKQSSSLTRIFNYAQAMAGEKRQNTINAIQKHMTFDGDKFDELCVSLLKNLVDYYQDLAETRNSYFSEKGGLVEHALSRTEAALSLCRAYFLAGDDKQENSLSEMQLLWLYALFSAGALQGIGKLMTDYIIEVFDEQGDYKGRWIPLHASLKDSGYFYDYETDNQKPDAHRRRLNVLLARQLMPEKGFEWISSNPDVLEIWLALLSEDHRSAGTLGPILIRADALAINRYFAEKNAKDFGKDRAKFAKATTFGIPSRDKDAIPSANENSGEAGVVFIKWLNKALASGKLMINKAPLFVVPGGMLMNPDIFKYFIREHPQFKNWQEIQQSFLGLNLHSVDSGGNAVQRFKEAKNNQIHTGVVFSKYALVLPETVNIMNMNTGVVKQSSALDAINNLTGSNFYASSKGQTPAAMKSLNAQGQWTDPTKSKPKNEQGFSGG